MKKALVLGCGLIGKTVALDLAEDFSVTVMDPFEKALAGDDAFYNYLMPALAKYGIVFKHSLLVEER